MFKNRFNEIRSGWIILLAIVLMAGGNILGFGAVSIISNRLDISSQIVLEVINLIPMIIMLPLILLAFKLIYNRPFQLMGFYSEGWLSHLLLGGLLGIILFGLAIGLLVVTQAVKLEDINIRSIGTALFWIGFVRFILVGFYEEIVCRGLMMTALKTTRIKLLIITFPSIIFGLLHLLNSNITIFSLANTMLVGILFGYLFIKTGRLWVPIGLHITWNFVQGYIWGIPVSGTEIPSSSLMHTVFKGPDYLTGGPYGVEGGAACTLVIILGLLFTHFCLKQKEEYWRMNGDLPLIRLPK